MGKNTRKSTPTVKAIHQHWLKEVLENPKHWSATLGDSAFENILEGEGNHCYACGGEYSLQRAHIVPHSLEGSNTADNLFLLCRVCHKENPDTTYADMFFRYVKYRDCHISRLLKSNYLSICEMLKWASSDEKLLVGRASQVEHTIDRIKEYFTIGMGKDASIAAGTTSLATISAILWKSLLKVGAEASEHTALAAA